MVHSTAFAVITVGTFTVVQCQRQRHAFRGHSLSPKRGVQFLTKDSRFIVMLKKLRNSWKYYCRIAHRIYVSNSQDKRKQLYPSSRWIANIRTRSLENILLAFYISVNLGVSLCRKNINSLKIWCWGNIMRSEVGANRLEVITQWVTL